MKKLKVIVGIDKGQIITSNKRIVVCGKNFGNVMEPSIGVNAVVVEMRE